MKKTKTGLSHIEEIEKCGMGRNPYITNRLSTVLQATVSEIRPDKEKKNKWKINELIDLLMGETLSLDIRLNCCKDDEPMYEVDASEMRKELQKCSDEVLNLRINKIWEEVELPRRDSEMSSELKKLTYDVEEACC